MEGLKVQIEGSDKTITIPYLVYEEDHATPSDEELDEKIVIQTIEFAKSNGLREGDYMLRGTEDEVIIVQRAIIEKNAEEQKRFKYDDQRASE